MQANGTLNKLNFKASAKLASCFILVIAADFLFYKEDVGWTLGLFGLMLLFLICLHNKIIEGHKLANIASYASLGLAFALVENPGCLTFWLFYFTIIFMVVSPKLTRVDDARRVALASCQYLLTSWWYLYRDSAIIGAARKRWWKTGSHKRIFIKNWFLPVGLSFVFIMLFAMANPILAGWLNNINWMAATGYFSLRRIFFWMFIACVSWALLRPRLRGYSQNLPAGYSKATRLALMTPLFNERSVFISLILFNVLFFMQNVMDIAFLWSGVDLPSGLTYAQYARQGAYPLIATALLTAIFVLIAFKPQGAVEGVPAIRQLVYIWVGQNVFLVISSITRLMNYISGYSLTYMRVAALIWMGLVAFGLILIVARIYLRKSSKWLVNYNVLALYCTLYICCFINFGGIIAGYNIQHSREVVGVNGSYLDIYYLQDYVGEDAIPALLWFERNKADNAGLQKVQDARKALINETRQYLGNWRGWTFRRYRLLQEIGNNNSSGGE